jgi:hypothetical protein
MNTSLDKAFADTGLVKFYPYIGDAYFESSPRILVLSESHYVAAETRENAEQLGELNSNTNTTRDAVEERYKPYQNTAALLSNRVIDNEYVYEKAAWYTFFQKYVGFGSGDKSLIDDALITLSQKAYFKVIELLKPELVIAWGVGGLYDRWVPQDECDILSEDKLLYKYKQYSDTLIWHIRHPSAPMFDLFETTRAFSELCKKQGYGYPVQG